MPALLQWLSLLVYCPPPAATAVLLTVLEQFVDQGIWHNWADAGGECGVVHERRFKMPLPAPDKQWYSFNYGPVHFLQYSTEHHFELGMPVGCWHHMNWGIRNIG